MPMAPRHDAVVSAVDPTLAGLFFSDTSVSEDIGRTADFLWGIAFLRLVYAVESLVCTRQKRHNIASAMNIGAFNG